MQTGGKPGDKVFLSAYFQKQSTFLICICGIEDYKNVIAHVHILKQPTR